MPARDSQRNKVYAAERSGAPGDTFRTVGDCQAFVRQVIRSDWWRSKFPQARSVRVLDGRGRRYPCGGFRFGEGIIKLPVRTRNVRTILHELAHVALGSTYGTMRYPIAHHGPEFTFLYLTLTRLYAPALAAGVAVAYSTARVQVGGG